MAKSNILDPKPENCRRIKCDTPILTNEQTIAIKAISDPNYKAVTIPMLYNIKEENGLENAIENIFEAVDIAIDNGCNMIVLSDKGVDENKCAIPALLAGAGLHHHLIRQGTRMKVSIILENW